MVQPPSFEKEGKNVVCRLKKALYALKEAPKAWFEHLAVTLKLFGFNSTKSDHSLFLKFTSTSVIYILVYVDW